MQWTEAENHHHNILLANRYSLSALLAQTSVPYINRDFHKLWCKVLIDPEPI